MQLPTRITLKTTCFLAIAFLCRAIDVQAIELPPHPRLLLNADGVTQLKSGVARSVLVWAISLDGRLEEITAKEEGDEVVVAVQDADDSKRRFRWNLSTDSPGLKVE